MKEPKNPIKLIKDNNVYEPHKFLELKTPFSFICKSTQLYINEGDTPIYFKRKTNRGSYNLSRLTIKLDLIDIKYRIAKKNKSGKEIGYWIDSNGDIIKDYAN